MRQNLARKQWLTGARKIGKSKMYFCENNLYSQPVVTFNNRLMSIINPTIGKADIKNYPLNFNWPLPNQKQITEAIFWAYMSNLGYSVKLIVSAGRKQIEIGGKKRWATVTFFLVDQATLHGGGLAVVQDDKLVVTYYSFQLCMHEYEQRTIGRCLNEYKCKHCGNSYEIDSSD